MILICGIPSEPPLAMVRAHLERLRAPFYCFNQRQAPQAELAFEVNAGGVRGLLEVDGLSIKLEDVGGVYTRMMDEQILPELAGEAPGSPARRRAQDVSIGLVNWMEVAPARVLNRASAMASNGSKPFQGQLIRAHGFAIPETLISSEPDEVAAFWARHGKVVYKSISSERSIVRELRDEDLARLERIRACPVQFQEKVEGRDLRVHVVGTRLFATSIRAESDDYRYAANEGEPARLTPCELDDGLAQRCLRLSSGLGLLFAGIDLRITPDGRAYCFEVNPSPGYSYYEGNTGQAISAAVAQLLIGRD